MEFGLNPFLSSGECVLCWHGDDGWVRLDGKCLRVEVKRTVADCLISDDSLS